MNLSNKPSRQRLLLCAVLVVCFQHVSIAAPQRVLEGFRQPIEDTTPKNKVASSDGMDRIDKETVKNTVASNPQRTSPIYSYLHSSSSFLLRMLEYDKDYASTDKEDSERRLADDPGSDFSTSYECECYSCSCGKGCLTSCCSTCYAYWDYCPAGSYAADGFVPAGTTCTACPAGKYQPDTGKSSCGNTCPAGSYCPAGSAAYQACTAGQYSAAGASSCSTCAAGKYSAAESASTCPACSGGRYQPETGASSCSNTCPAGYYCPAGSTTFHSCSIGKYAAVGSSSCTSCAAGTYNAYTAQASCFSRPGGQYQNNAGQTSCKACPAGYYCSTSSSAYVSCAAGKYSAAAASKCTGCTEGKYQPATTSTACLSCPLGFYCAANSSNYAACPENATCTLYPTALPSSLPSQTPLPSLPPTPLPTNRPSISPTPRPTSKPTKVPTPTPTHLPTPFPSLPPTPAPTSRPTEFPSPLPSLIPTPLPTLTPTSIPTYLPSLVPSPLPTLKPIPLPSSSPTPSPTKQPSPLPSLRPTVSFAPTTSTPYPSQQPTSHPSSYPSETPTSKPSQPPSLLPTPLPTLPPSSKPSTLPSPVPIPQPSIVPTPQPSISPLPAPTLQPTPSPSPLPSMLPSPLPTIIPTITLAPTSATTVSVAVVFDVDALGPPTNSDINQLKVLIANSTLVGLDSIKNFLVSLFDARRQLKEFEKIKRQYSTTGVRQMSAYYTWEVAFDIEIDLAETDFSSPNNFASNINMALSSSNFEQSLEINMPTTVVAVGVVETITATRNPSSSPTKSPTFLPTSYPTTSPTIYCPPGTYLSSETGLCVDCAPGYFSNKTEAPFPSECKRCVAGKYATTSKSSVCLECQNGKLSNMERTGCDNCRPGQFSFKDLECLNCTVGKYAPIPLSDDCLLCGSGFFTSRDIGATGCIACDAGKYSFNSSTSCQDCAIGKAQPASGQSSCTDCLPGKYADTLGEVSCISCSAGTIAPSTASPNCSLCGKGTFQRASGQSICEECAEGTFSLFPGATACSVCNLGYVSDASSSSCDLADAGYFVVTYGSRVESRLCPPNAQCVGRYQLPAPVEGYWVDRRSYYFNAFIHKCIRSTCTKSRRPDSACWETNLTTTRYSMNNHKCGSSSLLCLEGAQGPLCGSCKDYYIYSAETKTCKSCTDANFSIRLLVIASVVFFIAIMVGIILTSNSVWFVDLKRLLSSFDSGSLKVLWVTYQIIMSCSWNLDVTYPSPFNNLLGFFTIFSLDFLSLECIQRGTPSSRYFTKVYIWCCLPFLLIFCSALIGVARWLIVATRSGGISSTSTFSTQRNKIFNQHIWIALLITYIVLPAVANKQFQSLDCISLSEEYLFFLRADSEIDCTSLGYLRFRSVILLFIAIYQSIPIVWLILLYRKRHELVRNSNSSQHDEKLELFIRDKNKSLDHLRFLFHDYKINKWWFEVGEMYRRIVFIGVLPLTSTMTTKRASFGCYLAIVSIVYFREKEPFRLKFTNFIAYVSQFAILITFFTAISIDLNVMMDFGLDDFGIGLFLVLCNLSLAFMVVFVGLQRFNVYKKHKEGLQARAENLEWACEFSASKFKTTFDAINNTDISASDILLFHYTSFAVAKLALRSGLPALKRFSGIPFTLRYPHDCGSLESSIFKTPNTMQDSQGEVEQPINDFPADVLLVYALPRILLRPLKGYEDEAYLCALPVSILQGLRPIQPTNILDNKAWNDGVVMLPPTCCLRSYQLVELNETQSDQVRSNGNSGNSGGRGGSGTRAISSTVPSLSFAKLSMEYAKVNALNKQQWYIDTPLSKLELKDVVQLKFIDDYLDHMNVVQERAKNMNLVPLFHYTSPSILNLILSGGLRMSTQGQGDGGVYFSLRGPLSYGLGRDKYEENIIKDCFGVERIDEYLGKGKLEALVVYGCERNVLLQAPGGRDNAKMVPRSYFNSLMLPHSDLNYFLRPDRILAAFVVHSKDIKLKDHFRAVEMIKVVEMAENLLDFHNQLELYGKKLLKVSDECCHRSNQMEVDSIMETGNLSHMKTESDSMRLSDIYDKDKPKKDLRSLKWGRKSEERNDDIEMRVLLENQNPLYRPSNITLSEGDTNNNSNLGNNNRKSKVVQLSSPTNLPKQEDVELTSKCAEI